MSTTPSATSSSTPTPSPAPAPAPTTTPMYETGLLSADDIQTTSSGSTICGYGDGDTEASFDHGILGGISGGRVIVRRKNMPNFAFAIESVDGRTPLRIVLYQATDLTKIQAPTPADFAKVTNPDTGLAMGLISF